MANASRRPRSVCENSVKKIGRLSFNRKDLIGEGSYGKIFKGKFKESEGNPEIEVAIKRIETIDAKKIEIEIDILEKIEAHPNILRYYCTEEDDDFM